MSGSGTDMILWNDPCLNQRPYYAWPIALARLTQQSQRHLSESPPVQGKKDQQTIEGIRDLI